MTYNLAKYIDRRNDDYVYTVDTLSDTDTPQYMVDVCNTLFTFSTFLYVVHKQYDFFIMLYNYLDDNYVVH